MLGVIGLMSSGLELIWGSYSKLSVSHRLHLGVVETREEGTGARAQAA